jgi:hypothetical protein
MADLVEDALASFEVLRAGAPVQFILQVVLNILLYVGWDIISVGNGADASKRDRADELRRVERQMRVDKAGDAGGPRLRLVVKSVQRFLDLLSF